MSDGWSFTKAECDDVRNVMEPYTRHPLKHPDMACLAREETGCIDSRGTHGTITRHYVTFGLYQEAFHALRRAEKHIQTLEARLRNLNEDFCQLKHSKARHEH
jgi:hypothetical protein